MAASEHSLHLPPGFLLTLHRALSRGRTPSEAATLLRQVGFETGHLFYTALEDTLTSAEAGADAPVRSLSPAHFGGGVSALFEDLGWGQLQWERIHPAIAALDSSNWIEAEGRVESHPSCHLTTGLLADLLSRTANSEVAVMEVECRSRGDERCRFLFGSPAALATLFEEIREGIPYTEALSRLT